MNDPTLWMSGAALIVSVFALFLSLSRASAADRIALEQKRSALRLESHSVAIRVADLASEICSVDPTPQLLAIAKNLTDTGLGLIDCRRRIARMNPPPFIGALMITNEFESMCTDMKEMVNVLDKAETFWTNGQLNELQSAVEGLHRRIWAGEEEPTQPEVAIDGAELSK